jgi:hypothetical protein
MKRPVGEGEDLEIDTLLDRQPVKVRQKRCDVAVATFTTD